jgi:hypothetical protein
MERINVSLPPELRSRLDAASAESGKSVADEIRSRVEWMFALDAFEPVDKPTLDLMRSVATMAAELERETGTPWHAHAGSHAVLRQELLSRLARLKPEGDRAFGPRPHRAEPYDDPQELGVELEFTDWENRDLAPAVRQRVRLAREENFQEIMKVQQQREQGGSDE